MPSPFPPRAVPAAPARRARPRVLSRRALCARSPGRPPTAQSQDPAS